MGSFACPWEHPSKVREAALKCLGSMGPLELNVPALTSAQWSSMPGTMGDGDTCQRLCYRILFAKMEEYLSHHDSAVSGLTCRALKRALATQSGAEFASRQGSTDMRATFAFLHPFMSPGSKVVAVGRPPSSAAVSCLEMWAPDQPQDHACWIKSLTCALICSADDQVLWALLPVCELSTELCELLFPFLVEMLAEQGSHWSDVAAGVNVFLERHVSSCCGEVGPSQSTMCSEPLSSDSVSGLVYGSRASVSTLLAAVERMVVRKKPGADTLWEGLRLPVNYLHAALAAESCGNHVAALQYLELWWDQKHRELSQSSQDEEQAAVDYGGAPLLHWEGAEASQVQALLLSAFSGLGDLDGLAGCRCLALDAGSVWRRCAEKTGDWTALLASADLEAAARNARTATALKQCGLYHVLGTYLEGAQESPELAEQQAECAWRLGNWDARLPRQCSGETGFHRGVFSTLSALVNQEEEALDVNINVCWSWLSGELSSLGHLSSTQELCQLLSKLQMCSVLEEGISLFRGELPQSEVLSLWEQRTLSPGCRFQLSEPVWWLEGVLLSQLHPSGSGPALATMLHRYAVQARCNHRPQLAQVALKELSRREPLQSWRWDLEAAHIHLAQGDFTQAQHTLWRLLRQLEQTSGRTPAVEGAYAEVLQLYGECLTEARSENSDTIAREYLEKAVCLLEVGPSSEALWSAHLRLARFADARLQSIDQYLRSPEFMAKQELLHQSSHILTSTPSRQKNSLQDARALRLLERQSDLDRGEAQELRSARDRYLVQALKNYLCCLKGSHRHDLRLFRLTSLWVDNATLPQVCTLLQEGLGQLESSKFVPLIYQLAARMRRPTAGASSDFSNTLFELIERVVREHPYQTLTVVLALCNAEKDTTAEAKVPMPPRAKKPRAAAVPAEDRVEGARYLVSKLRKVPSLSSILPQMEKLMNAYIELAYLSPPVQEPGQPAITVVSLPRKTALLKLGCLDSVPVLTRTIKVSRSCSYSHLVGIHRFEQHYRLCGGINMPKVVTCIGQDGCSYKQLVKGRDDLRQDAVMQQAFELVNQLLQQQQDTQDGPLRVRTYKVVPLSRRSGLVQWCEGTQPFGEFLFSGRSGAHQRYRPNDWTAMACRRAMQSVLKGTPEERLEKYREVCHNFHPVFRYFFLEHFPEPTRWFERRRAYVHSVATGSIVGYILGLGDRHCANILVDKHTAELIHIDLGVAFEQGRTLNTPETVPFRLTRDVVDGMGICGVEGTFRRCCERTMQVMRSSRESLATVVEVLVHDPLSVWTLSPERAATLQPGLEDTGLTHRSRAPDACDQPPAQHDQKNRLARRVLLRLEQKLQGLEEGSPLSVAGQVNLLIQQARDPHNLSRLYPGWQPYV